MRLRTSREAIEYLMGEGMLFSTIDDLVRSSDSPHSADVLSASISRRHKQWWSRTGGFGNCKMIFIHAAMLVR